MAVLGGGDLGPFGVGDGRASARRDGGSDRPALRELQHDGVRTSSASVAPGDPEAETGVGLGHTEPGMLTVSRKNDFAGGAGVLFSQSVATVIFRHNLFGGIGQV